MNKKQFNTFSIVVFMLMLFTSNLIFAQTAKITGKVVDKANGETLIGLAVGIEGTTKGTLTDVEGRFSLTGLAAGKYNLTFRYLGYQPKTITAVEVKAGQVTTVDVQLEQSATQSLKEVVVTASYKQETVGALYAKQKNNISISNGISADQIKKSPDRNTSEVLKRVSGTSIQDNKFVVIRGLSDRYNSTLLNGAVLPSTEPDKKASDSNTRLDYVY
ncbi:carboxypeptidase-like regulatory domain-containing protein, partial [Pseudopedobacter sp.]|uniref:carboxypeptidase-like regulatory domain-containing protein n=1 Tax=Pseudopedobacter sp. TaxID=1936787 RepID=UPI003340ECE1